MRLLLDAHISGRAVGRRLQDKGHDVRALDQEPEMEGLDDEGILLLATHERRILVTRDVDDFPRILRDWAEEARSHAGTILIYGIAHNEFDPIARGVERWLTARPDQDDWIDFPAVVDRDFATR